MRDVPRPPLDAVVRAGDDDADRVLLIGSGPAVGWGVLTHEVSLAGHLARQVSKALGSGVEVVVHAETRMTAAGLAAALETVDDLPSYSAVVFTVGVNDAFIGTGPDAWTAGLQDALRVCEAHGVDPAQVVVMQIQSVASIPAYSARVARRADVHRVQLNAATARLLSSPERGRVAALSNPAPRPDRYRDSSVYAHWAADIAPAVIDVLRADRLTRASGHRGSRARTLEALGLSGPTSDPAIPALLADVRSRMRASYAAFVVVDEDGTERFVATEGFEAARSTEGIVRVAVRSAGPFVVYDAHRDRRLTGRPVPADPRLRFYAAMPVQAPSGETIGALGVADVEPRTAADVDITVLRDAARRLQAHLRLTAARP
ncbi:GAF domain-containing protein [Leifsonia sp. NPDC058248]|uniref:GAF domain-containing protein n=1 Tax=Leifsonia sp. NPDC058248 TaxID=3346402 RepID=UPI0036DD9478